MEEIEAALIDLRKLTEGGIMGGVTAVGRVTCVSMALPPSPSSHTFTPPNLYLLGLT
ncbi:MAG: hypothetical protein L0287_21290 [Anaerolineae bacterium]|nr:hypothetical protein [Anaerolineae bacterium]MCI0609491.1 hypothetical protein [Anaerolineae bacterium]